ncbi:sensor histidine kinase [Roseateles koreensis]|uniref:histidine kinase n=1 Tax=Roseateles koreensis TaxID=2987526 RepID=A0ABT5KMJ5_9BURK|nr:sensor histidine kinase [Roseateles koreensis]MDC8784129.1 sensor histidine kinase [Roseateles koreensis]
MPDTALPGFSARVTAPVRVLKSLVLAALPGGLSCGLGLSRWLSGAMLVLGTLALPQVHAQGLTTPGVAPVPSGQHMRSAELALSQWSGDDLNEWWAALRAMDGSPGSLPAHLQPPTAPANWKPVQLPDTRSRDVGSHFNADKLYQMRWYRFRFDSDQGFWPTSMALYIPRLVTMAAAVLVHTDEGWRPVFDNQAGAREQWVRPLWVVFPAALTELSRDQSLEIVLAVPVLNDNFYAVSSVWLGPREDLEPRYRRRWALQIGVPQATGLTLVVLGLFSMSLWVKRRDDSAYLLFALAAVGWLLRNLHYHVDLPRTRLGLEWFWWLTHASMSWVMVLTFLFVLRFSRRQFPRFEKGLISFVVLGSLMTLPLWRGMFDALVAQHAVNAVVGAVCTLFVAVIAFNERRYGLRIIAVSMFLSLLLGIHDLVMLAGWTWQEHIYVMPFATLMMVASFLYAVQNRYVGALFEVALLNENLAQRLDAQSRELQAQHDRLREAERQQALLLERQRLMQDMHDGLGSSLLSAMVAVEQGTMGQDRVVEVLRECVDDLRLVIDSLEPIGHDLVSLLATMRYRLGKRLQAGGLHLEWDVQDLPPLTWLEPPDALHVLRLMQEALTNVIKHANAGRVRLVTRHHSSYVEIRVEDDGTGFDVENAPRGRGLKSQQRRAQRLGGSVRIESSPGQGTRLSLRLPVHRPEPPDKHS